MIYRFIREVTEVRDLPILRNALLCYKYKNIIMYL